MRAWFATAAAAVVALVCGVARADDHARLRVAIAHIEGDADVVRRQVARFVDAHAGVEVELVSDRQQRTPQHDLWARYLALGDPSIDIYVIDEPWIDEFAFAGWIRPLDSLSAWAREEVHAAGLRSGTWRDRLYAVPMELSGNALFYRSDWLASAGLAAPRTLEELFADARRIAGERHLGHGLVLHAQALFNDVNPMLWASGGGPFQSNKVRLDDPLHVDVFSSLRAEVGGALPSALELRTWRDWPSDYHTAVDAFGSGDAAFMINWLRFRPPGLERESYRVAPIPGLAGHAPGTGATLGSWFWTVNTASEHALLATELIRFLSSEQACLERFQELGAYPPLARFYSDKAWVARFPDLAVAGAIFANAQPRMPVTDEHAVDEIVERAYEEILIDGAAPLPTLAAASKAANEALAAYPSEQAHFEDPPAPAPSDASERGRLVVAVAVSVWLLATAMLLVGAYLGRRRGGLFRRLATKVSVLGLTAVLLALTTGTAVALRMLVKNQEDAIAEAQSFFRASIREHAAALGRQIALDASVLREVSEVGTKMIGDARRRAQPAGAPAPTAREPSGSDDLAEIEAKFEESLEVLAAEGAYSRDIIFLQLLDTDGVIAVDDTTLLASRRGATRTARRVIEDPSVRELARFGRRMSMRDVPAGPGHPAYLEVMVPLVQNGRQAGAVRIGYSKQDQEERLEALRTRQEHLLTSAVYLVTLAALGLIALATALLRRFARSVAQPLVRLTDLAGRVGGGDLSVRADVGGRDEVSALAHRLNGMVEGLREREVIRETFGRYVGPSVSDAILAGRVELGGEERVVTLLFSDVRGFTTMSEAMQPREVVRVLNVYFEQMVESVFEHEGMLDKFIGDGLMAVFGAPSHVADHAMCAVRCALDMRRRLVEVNAGLRAAGLPELQIGIGLHTGPVVVGNIGSTKRTEYTAIGDAVNLAARLESQTKEQGVDILMSEATHAAVEGRVVSERLGEVQVKGKNSGVVIHALRSLAAG